MKAILAAIVLTVSFFSSESQATNESLRTNAVSGVQALDTIRKTFLTPEYTFEGVLDEPGAKYCEVRTIVRSDGFDVVMKADGRVIAKVEFTHAGDYWQEKELSSDGSYSIILTDANSQNRVNVVYADDAYIYVDLTVGRQTIQCGFDM